MICKECGGTEWGFIINDIVHDDKETSLFQCKKCKRIIVHTTSFIGYDSKEMIV